MSAAGMMLTLQCLFLLAAIGVYWVAGPGPIPFALSIAPAFILAGWYLGRRRR